MFVPILQTLKPFAQEFVTRGKQVYLVGGAVRDLLLGRPVKDLDFTTDALPTEVQGYFPKVLPTGLQHGTVTVLFQGTPLEVTTFRVDGKYTDGRRPDGVTFTPSLEEDLKRRDFTINAMALNLSDGTLIDPHQGREDLHRGVLRAIGDPGTRFEEDALRLLRLFRFSSQLGFSVDPQTLAAVPSRRPLLAAVSRERVREELIKALAGGHPQNAWGLLGELGFLKDLFAPLDPRTLSESHLHRLNSLAKDVRWSFWLTLACAPQRAHWEDVLKGLKWSNADLAAALGPTLALDFLEEEGPLTVQAKAMVEAWGTRGRVAVGLEYLSALEAAGFWADNRGLVRELRRVACSEEPIFLGDLALGGKDLIAIGYQPGPQLGKILKSLQKEVWLNPAANTKSELTSRLPGLQ